MGIHILGPTELVKGFGILLLSNAQYLHKDSPRIEINPLAIISSYTAMRYFSIVSPSGSSIDSPLSHLLPNVSISVGLTITSRHLISSQFAG